MTKGGVGAGNGLGNLLPSAQRVCPLSPNLVFSALVAARDGQPCTVLGGDLLWILFLFYLFKILILILLPL